MDWKKAGLAIKQKRLKKKMSQEDLANEIGVSTAFICQIERGIKKPSADNLLKISKTLGLNFFYPNH